MKVFRFIYEILRKFPFLLIGNILLLMISSAIGVVSIFSIAPVIDYLLHPNLQGISDLTQKAIKVFEVTGLPVTLMSFLGVFLGFQILKNGFGILSQYLILRTKYIVLRDLLVGTLDDFFRARWMFFSTHKQGMLLNTCMREMDVTSTACKLMGNFFATILNLIFYLIVPFYISWQVTSISLLVAIIFASPFLLLSKLSYRLGQQNTSTANRLTSVIQESLSSAKLILGFGNQYKSQEDLKNAFDVHRQVTVKSQTLGAAMPFMYEPLGLLVVVIALFFAQRNAIPLSELAVLLWSLRNTLPSVGNVVAQKNALTNFYPSYEQVKALRKRAQELKQRSGKRPFKEFEREVVVKNLTFAHPGHEPTLVDVSLHIPKDSMVALVGESGAGKSTLIDLILGFHEPQAGQITLDGTPLEHFDIHSYRQRIGYVPQDSTLFNMTIRDNLRWAKEDVTDEEVEEACRMANADDFIRGFPKGYDTIVGDRGVRLSGGQCQRVALARAILRKPELLILDEATSSLDTQSERLIQSAIETIARKTTVIVIAHRLSTIVNADYVYVLHKGRVVEEGTYQSLVDRKGTFSRMAQLQVLETATGG